MARLKTPFTNVSWTPYTKKSLVAGLIALFFLLTIIVIALFVFLGWVVAINIGDIIHNGPNFWNIFWVVIAGGAFLGMIFGTRNAK